MTSYDPNYDTKQHLVHPKIISLVKNEITDMQTKSPSLKRPQIYAVRGNIWARTDRVDSIFRVRLVFDEIWLKKVTQTCSIFMTDKIDINFEVIWHVTFDLLILPRYGTLNMSAKFRQIFTFYANPDYLIVTSYFHAYSKQR